MEITVKKACDTHMTLEAGENTYTVEYYTHSRICSSVKRMYIIFCATVYIACYGSLYSVYISLCYICYGIVLCLYVAYTSAVNNKVVVVL